MNYAFNVLDKNLPNVYKTLKCVVITLYFAVGKYLKQVNKIQLILGVKQL